MDQRTHIKVCGIKSPDVATAAIQAGADMIGFVFVPASPRYITPDAATRIVQSVPPHVLCVGVFKDHTAAQVTGIHNTVPRLAYVQLHGHSRQLLNEWGHYSVLCALSFDENFESELERWGRRDPEHHRNLEGLVIDAPDPSGLGGGTGQTFDWTQLREILNRVRPNVRVLLAGGLTPENVGEAIRTVRPWGVDVSSGVESARGVKDVGKIKAFCDAVREADATVTP